MDLKDQCERLTVTCCELDGSVFEQVSMRDASIGDAALQSLRDSLSQQGLRPRAELQGSSQRMQFEMDQAETSLKNDNVAEARQHLDYAERALESLEKALNL